MPAFHAWTAVQKRCIGHLCLYGKTGCLTIHKSKNIQRTITKSSMVNWNGMFNVEKKFGENWFRGKPSVKSGYVTYLYLFTCPHETFFLGLHFGTTTEQICMVDGLTFSFSYKLVPFCYVIYEKTN
jgi:hypothetical protein